MKYYKGFKVRIYPTKEQEEAMWKHIHSCRFIWNYMLEAHEKIYNEERRTLSAFDMIKMLTSLKDDGVHNWLNNIAAHSCEIVCQDLQKSYESYFKHIKNHNKSKHKSNYKFKRFPECHPNFKSKKKSKANFPTDHRIWFDKDYIHIIKIGKIKYKTDYALPYGRNTKFYNVRISNKNGKWTLSATIEIEKQDFPKLKDDSIGIDLGIKNLATVSFLDESIVFYNINKSKKMRLLNKRLRHLQRDISRKYEQNKVGRKYIKTNNILKQEEQLRRLYAKISNIRNNYIHQITAYLTSLRSKTIIMEDLNVSGMMKNKHLSKAIQEQNFYEFRRQMEYKCLWNGIKLVFADRFYPSSKTCSCCGNVKKDLKLSDRVYKCNVCGFKIDRDFNAALNLSRYEG